MPPLICLVGSTASGKSALAHAFAKSMGAEILSCDSLLIYKELNIGTAKPSEAELAEIPHHGINLISITQEFNAGDYVRYARPIIDQCMQRKKPLLIVGGTGFYLKALLCGIWDVPPTQPEIRADLQQQASLISSDPQAQAEWLYNKLVNQDPQYASKIKSHDLYRILRGLEIIAVSGKSVTDLLAEHKQDALPYEYKIFGIQRNKLELEKRIIERANHMFSSGLVTETKNLLQNFSPDSRAMQCVGYREVLEFLSGKITLPECRERVVISTRQLAKKQKTFFKTFPAQIAWHLLPTQEEDLLRSMTQTFD